MPENPESPSGIPLRSIVVIVLRLYSLSWLMQGLVSVAIAGGMAGSSPTGPYWTYAGQAIFVVAAVLLWVFAGTVARTAAPDPDAMVHIGGLTRDDLDRFAFVFLGLYFILSSAGSAMSEIYMRMLLSNMPGGASFPRAQTSEFNEPLVTFIAGILCMVFSSRFSRKLSASQHKDDAGLR